MIASDDHLLTLDIGSTSVRALVGRLVGDRVVVCAVGEATNESAGVGTPLHHSALAECIRSASSQAMSLVGVRVQRAYVGVPARFVELHDVETEVSLRGPVVTNEDRGYALERARSTVYSSSRDVIHQRVLSEWVDGQRVDNARGVAGASLRMRTQLYTCVRHRLQVMEEAAKQAGLHVEGYLFESLATATATLRSDERSGVTVLVDMGAIATDVCIVHDGIVQRLSTVPSGGASLVEELAVSLRVSMDTAARLQERAGCRYSDDVGSMDVLEFASDDGGMREVPVRAVVQVVEPRVREILEELRLHIREALDGAPAHIVLVGGSVWLNGFEDQAREVFHREGWRTRLGVPHGVSGGRELVSQPKYSVVVGLLLEARQARIHGRDVFFSTRREKEPSRFMSWIRNMFDKLL